MKRGVLLERYEFHSGKASDVARQLAFAGIATIWLFHVGDPSRPSLPKELAAPLLLLSAALALDFLQYLVCAAIWGSYHRMREWGRLHHADDKDVDAPGWINWPALALFWGKMITMVAAQILLIRFVAQQWRIFG